MALGKNQNIATGEMPRCKAAVLVLGKEYPISGVVNLYGRSDTPGFCTIYFVNPCYRILLAWDEYLQGDENRSY